MGNTEWKPEGMIQPLWATPIYQNQARGKEFDEIQEELKTVTAKLKFGEAEGWGPHVHDLSEKPFDSNFLYDNKCAKTVDNMNDALGGNFIYNCLGGKTPAPLDNGILLMWPSNIRHETQENTTDNERLSLSFNINFNRIS